MIPSPRSRDSNVVEGVRQCKTAVDRGWRREFECYWNLLISDTVPSPTFECCWRLWTALQRLDAVDRWWRLNACQCMQRRQWERCINLGLLTVTYGIAFWDVYRIISYRIAIFCAVSYRIHHFPPRPYRAITRFGLGIEFGLGNVRLVTDARTTIWVRVGCSYRNQLEEWLQVACTVQTAPKQTR